MRKYGVLSEAKCEWERMKREEKRKAELERRTGGDFEEKNGEESVEMTGKWTWILNRAYGIKEELRRGGRRELCRLDVVSLPHSLSASNWPLSRKTSYSLLVIKSGSTIDLQIGIFSSLFSFIGFNFIKMHCL